MKNNFVYKYKYYLLVILLLLIVGLTFGYSKLMATLEIDADVNVSPVKWNVSFSDISINEESFTNDDSNYVRIDPEKPNKISFNITLNPGDFYEFTVKLKNTGTINAKLNSINETGTTEETLANSTFIDYSITGLPQEGNVLNVNDEQLVRVRIEYLKDLGETANFNLEKEFELNYIQN